MHKTCEGHTDHAQVRGKDGKASEGYTDELVEETVNCVLDAKNRPSIKGIKELTKGELEAHQKAGNYPYDSRCKDCLLGGIKDRPHYRRTQRETHLL